MGVEEILHRTPRLPAIAASDNNLSVNVPTTVLVKAITFYEYVTSRHHGCQLEWAFAIPEPTTRGFCINFASAGQLGTPRR
jgi:hypothetical protein